MYKYLFTGLLLLITLGDSLAQPTPAKKNAVTVAKFKPPVVVTSLGKHVGVSAFCTAEEGKALLSAQLKIADEKNQVYALTTYQFAYKRQGITEDETTGMPAAQSDMVAERFETTPLPKLWQNIITEQLHSGEELYFFDIMVKDSKGRLFYAPDLKITIQ